MHQQGSNKKQRFSSRANRMAAGAGPAVNSSFIKDMQGGSSQHDIKVNVSGQYGAQAHRPQSKTKYKDGGHHSATYNHHHHKNSHKELNYDEKFINRISQQAGKQSKVTLERTLEAASREQKSRQRLMTLDEKIILHKQSNSSGVNSNMRNQH